MPQQKSDRPAGRPNHVVIDLGAIAHNVRVLRSLIADGTQICAAVKANAYGFGLLEASRALVDAGVDRLALVDVGDAISLRESGIAAPILIYGGNLVDADLIRVAEQHDLELTVCDQESAALASSLSGRPIRVFVEVDVGQERVGAPVRIARDLVDWVIALPRLELGGIYTHVHVPTGGAASYVQWQFDRFKNLVDALRRTGVSVPIAMAASSDVRAMSALMDLDAVDVGKWLYGSVPGLSSIGLRFAFHSLSSRITQVKAIDRVAYLENAPIQIREGLRIGVVPMGIADGLGRLNCGQALVRGRRVSILGQPSLEHCRLDLTEIPDAAVGDSVVFVGAQGASEIAFSELPATEGGSATWRAATEVRESVQRTYLR